jgi:hypothetical protein
MLQQVPLPTCSYSPTFRAGKSGLSNDLEERLTDALERANLHSSDGDGSGGGSGDSGARQCPAHPTWPHDLQSGAGCFPMQVGVAPSLRAAGAHSSSHTHSRPSPSCRASQWERGVASGHYIYLTGAPSVAHPDAADRVLIQFGGHRCEDGRHDCLPFKQCAAHSTRKVQLWAVGWLYQPRGATGGWRQEQVCGHEDGGRSRHLGCGVAIADDAF